MNINPHFNRQFVGTLFALGLASVLSVGLLIARAAVSWQLTHFYLAWNLFLAWLPLVFAVCAWRSTESKKRLLVFSVLWLLFLPNAPYLVTDLVHLKERAPIPFWFDVVLLQSLICHRVLIGFVSLYLNQCLSAIFVGQRGSWLFVIAVVGLTAFGIYLGRVQRWNSWDALLNPFDLATDIFAHFFRPHRRSAGLFSILYAGFLFVAYVLWYLLTQLKLEIKTKSISHESSL